MSKNSSLFSNLNSAQRQAVEAKQGHFIISAGPGTGKTRTLTHRVAYLIKEKQISPKNILTVTFTRSAAEEMKDRLHSLLKDTPLPWIDTFHAVAYQILKENVYSNHDISLISEEQKIDLAKDLMPKKEIKKFLEGLSQKKRGLKKSSLELEKQYDKKLSEENFIDFDDLLLKVMDLFDKNPEALDQYKKRFETILVDEFQDTSLAQYEFLKKLSPPNLFLIGDPDQSIYRFSTDEFEPFEALKKDFEPVKVLSLSENYRSQSTIIKAATQVIDKNPSPIPRQLIAKMEKGFPIEIHPHQTETQEAEMIVKKIEGLLGGASYFTIDTNWAEQEAESQNYGLNDIVILYRFHAQATKIETALNRAGLPYHTYGKKIKKHGEVISTPSEFDDREHLQAEAIKLMSLHRSKGLEFPVVFLAGCEKGILPSEENNQDERRLFYVGMTRAKNRLFLTYAKKRFLFGKFYEQGPSPFVTDIEDELKTIEESKLKQKKKRIQQPMLFDL